MSGHERRDGFPGRPARKTCLIVHPSRRGEGRGSSRTADARLAEAIGLAKAIDLCVVDAEAVNVVAANPSTLFGKGTVTRLAELITSRREEDAAVIDVVVVDSTLTPIQQRNLEKAWNAKVVDRTGLILEIFGERASTAEGEMQVELAALTYQKSRLVRSWTHLERQRGGFGFIGGPGESQIETDRRLIRNRIARLTRQLAQVRRTRDLHRRARRRTPYPIVALVGYTNAGKSTLFNRLTASAVRAEDMLFATLDPTMRALDLPSGTRVILADTVGFISDLPHELVEAFRATLEEVTEADVIVDVRDVSHPETEAQKEDVEGVLRDLGLGRVVDSGEMLEALNKIDALPDEERLTLENRVARSDGASVMLSALTGDGCDALIALLDRRLSQAHRVIEVSVAPEDGATLAWLYRHGEVLAREDAADGTHVSVRLSERHAAQFAQRDEGERPASKTAQR